MALLQVKNFASSTLNADIASSATSFVMASGGGDNFPSSGDFICAIWGNAYSSPSLDPSRELVKASLTSGDTFTIERAQEDTTASSWSAGDNLALVFTAGKQTELEEVIQNNLLSFGTATGTNTYNAILTPAVTSYTDGMMVNIKFANANTSTATLGLNSLAAKKIYRLGDTGYDAVASGGILAGMYSSCLYDSSLDSSGGGWILSAGSTAAEILAKLLTVDGAGSGLDADKLDGIDSAYYSGLDQGAISDDPDETLYQHIFTNSANGPNSLYYYHIQTQFHGTISATSIRAQIAIGHAPFTADAWVRKYYNTWSDWVRIDNDASDILAKLNTVGGTGSGLDADLLDGSELSAILSTAAGYVSTHYAISASTSIIGHVELATSTETQTGTDTTKAITPDGLNDTCLGLGQTWQDMSASRSSEVTYTNSTGKPIMVIVTVNQAGGLIPYVDDVMLSNGDGINDAKIPVSFIVPNGSSYYVQCAKYNTWTELR